MDLVYMRSKVFFAMLDERLGVATLTDEILTHTRRDEIFGCTVCTSRWCPGGSPEHIDEQGLQHSGPS